MYWNMYDVKIHIFREKGYLLSTFRHIISFVKWSNVRLAKLKKVSTIAQHELLSYDTKYAVDN